MKAALVRDVIRADCVAVSEKVHMIKGHSSLPLSVRLFALRHWRDPLQKSAIVTD